ncbi:MAG TPA: type II secretion system protein [Rhodoblastus sp.]|nr:type II secretion system protein [Rhodoblastus sp.]
MRPGLARRRGFTLIEALAAFAIMALALGQLLASISMGAANERRADFLLRAAADAQSHLAALGVTLPLAPGETSSRYEDGLAWTLNVERDRGLASTGAASSVVAYRVHLAVSAAAGPPLNFVAEKLVFPQLGGGAR